MQGELLVDVRGKPLVKRRSGQSPGKLNIFLKSQVAFPTDCLEYGWAAELRWNLPGELAGSRDSLTGFKRRVERRKIKGGNVIQCWRRVDDTANQKPADAIYSLQAGTA